MGLLNGPRISKTPLKLSNKSYVSLIVSLSDFDKVFEVKCDASRVGIGVVII